jgi:hypothetical protein
VKRKLTTFLERNTNYLYPDEKLVSRCTLLLLLGLFVGQYLLFGLMYAFDTPKYEIFAADVYPLYPVFLWLFRSLFGIATGYNLLGVFQNVLLAFSFYSLIDYLRRTFRLDSITTLLMVLLSAVLFIAQKFFTQRGIISSNVLFSEALAIPFYLFYFRYLLEASMARSLRPLLLSCFSALCLILTRGQLYWVLVPIILVGLRLVTANRFKSFCMVLLSCALVVGTVSASRHIQTLQVSDQQTKSPLGMYLLTTAVYCSDRDDAALFEEGSGEKRLFEEVRPGMDDPARLAAFSYESGSLTNRHGNFEMHYDPLKEDVWSTYARITAEGLPVSLQKLQFTLIINNLPAYLLHCAQNALVGLIRTVAILRPGIDICACLFFAFLLLCCIWLPKKKLLPNEVHFVLVALFCTLLNALIMAPGVFALSRYVIYNMPVLYFCAMILLRALILELEKQH